MAKAKTTRPCSVDDCDRTRTAQGMCDAHYRRWRTTGTPHKTCRTCGKEMPGKMGRGGFYCSEECKTCKIEGCNNPSFSLGMCGMHDQRVRATGTPFRKCLTCGSELPEEFGQRRYCGPDCRPRCKAEGCDEPYRSDDGYCSRHKILVRKYGKPEGGYEWTPKAGEYTCLACGGKFPPNGKSRQFCGPRCQQLHKTYDGEIPELDFDCVMCGKHIHRNRWEELYQRGDKKLCDRCRVSKGKRHKSSPGYLAKRDGNNCGICGQPVDMDLKHPHPRSGSVDHIIPVAHGGTHDEENLQLSCLVCNLTKQARIDYRPA